LNPESFVLVDTQCYYDHGHWVHSVISFSKLIGSTGCEVSMVFPKKVKRFRLQDNNYLDQVNANTHFFLPNSKPMMFSLKQAAVRSVVSSFPKREPWSILTKSTLALLNALSPLLLVATRVPVSLKAKMAARRLVGLAEPMERSYVFPTADNYRATYPSVSKLLKAGAKMIYLRFVNSEPEGVGAWLRAFREGTLDLRRVSIAVENHEMLAAFHSAGLDPIVCPYPWNPDIIRDEGKGAKNAEDTLKIALLGAPRASKGYLDLPDYARLLMRHKNTFSLVAQTLGPGDAIHEELQTMPNCRTLPPRLDRSSFEHELSQTAILLLPYDVEVYKETSSAMLMEASDHDVPCMVPAGTGLQRDVERFGIGWTYNSTKELLEIISNLANDPSSITAAREGVQQFNFYRFNQAKAWLNSSL